MQPGCTSHLKDSSIKADRLHLRDYYRHTNKLHEHVIVLLSQQTLSGFSPSTVPNSNRQSGISPTTVPKMSTGFAALGKLSPYYRPTTCQTFESVHGTTNRQADRRRLPNLYSPCFAKAMQPMINII